MSYLKDVKSVSNRVKTDFVDHCIIDNPVKSFHFRKIAVAAKYDIKQRRGMANTIQTCRFNRKSAYHFTFTWTPGTITITGDIGSITLMHYQAMANFEDALEWILEGDHDYLLTKSDKKQRFDQDATATTIIQMLNEPLLDQKHDREDLIQWKNSKEDYASDEEWIADKPKTIFTPFEFQQDLHFATTASLHRLWQIDEDWSFWLNLWMIYEGSSYLGNPISCDPTEIQTASFRKEMREWILSECEDPHGAANLQHNIGFDDPYIAYEWEWRDLYLIEAAKYACKAIMDASNSSS